MILLPVSILHCGRLKVLLSNEITLPQLLITKYAWVNGTRRFERGLLHACQSLDMAPAEIHSVSCSQVHTLPAE